MKHLLTLILLFVGLSGFGQIKFKAATSVGGTSLIRGGTFEYVVYANGNANNTTRQVLIDMQYDRNNFELVSVNHTGTGGNGGVLPQGSTISLTYYDYQGYTWNSVTSGNSANNTSNGTINYQYANYSYDAASANAILRTTLTWSTTSAMPFDTYSDFVKFVFRLKPTSTANTFNPIKLNFVAGWTATGTLDNTLMEAPLSTAVNMNQNYGKYVTAKVDLNSNLYNLSNLRVSFRDTVTNQGQLFAVLSDGSVDVNQALLNPNTVYDVTLMHQIEKTYAIYNNAITISDFSTAQAEFTSMGLPATKGTSLNTGQSLYAADINKNKVIDGGDLPRLLGQVAGLDTLMTIPAGYVAGTNGWMSLPTWKAADATTVGGQVEWAYIAPGASSSTLYIDMRKFPSGVTPSMVKSIQLFDLYTGPVEYLTEDAASWAQYRVPSTFTKAADGTSVYVDYIRINQGYYNLRVEFTFNTNPNLSWGNITTSNWNTISYPRTYFKTDVIGTNAFLDLKYLLWGDVNRSHSSQVVVSNSGTSTVQTNAVSSLQSNSTFKTMAISNMSFMNTPYDIASIDVNLSNITVTSNTIEIPVGIDTKGNNVGGLQFQFTYDPAKIKFEELANNLPNTWYTFVNAKDGIVKFGALDQANKNPVTGTSIPFKLKFSTIGNGVDILTSVRVSSTMDASSVNGTQLGINLNKTQIKLTGYNNF